MTTADDIRGFIVRSVLVEPYDGADPLADDMLDSLAIEQLIVHLEGTYRIRFADEEVVSANFSDLGTLAALVDAKRGA